LYYNTAPISNGNVSGNTLTSQNIGSGGGSGCVGTANIAQIKSGGLTLTQHLQSIQPPYTNLTNASVAAFSVTADRSSGQCILVGSEGFFFVP
jgi:hypothetical protein